MVKTSAVVCKKLWVQIPPEDVHEAVYHKVLESTEYAVLYLCCEKKDNFIDCGDYKEIFT